MWISPTCLPSDMTGTTSVLFPPILTLFGSPATALGSSIYLLAIDLES
ncbi:hypothetical protein [Methanobacterium oryzae]